MALRVSAQSGRIIMSKPGYDASSSLPDAFKLFDSNWGATGLIAFTINIVSGQSFVPFPFPLHFVPAAGRTSPGTITNTGIQLDFVPSFPSNETYPIQIWAISQ